MIKLHVAFLCAVLLLTQLTGTFAAEGERTVYAVWATPQMEQTTTLHYAAQSKGKWASPVQLQLNQGVHVTPVLAVDRKGSIWVVWVEQIAEENILRYAVIRQDKTETGRVIQPGTGKEQSYAPTILIDQQDVPWLAWSGVREQQFADIYVSKWGGKGWLEPVRVHEHNQSPDVTPLLGLRKEKNILWVAWFGISKKEDIYVRFVAELHEGTWQVDEKNGSIEETKDFIEKRTAVEPFPEQAGQWLTGALFAGLEKEIQSVSEHFVSFRKKEGEQ